MLTASDDAKLAKIHPLLAHVIRIASISADFKVLEGLRTKERQAELVAAGASQTLNSRHLTGHAVDIVPLVNGKVRWDWPLFYPLAEVIKRTATENDVPIEWGGDWVRFKDGPHWQLPFREFPA